ncbi:hypothetical protein HNQ91_002589 [Filimonas zeae]|uniref:hypothetical protein n=1 Tax=Filimonas zeae TaxID=1737353 RepID=UPI001664604C|nr:hypothetical protein [Filimonas zeae]MDR6339538.1 hypothetical protein [Filimonas zeae]
MNPFKNRLFIFLCLLLITPFFHSLYAQKHNPLLQFLQNNFDSVIVYHRYSAWRTEPHYEIVAKENKRTYAFIYKNPYVYIGAQPGIMKSRLIKEALLFKNTVPDTNRYLVPARVYNEKSDSLWHTLTAADFWNLNDSLGKQNSCNTPGGGIFSSYDAEEVRLFFITRTAIMQKSFYDPEEFDKACSDDINRKKVIAARKAFAYYLTAQF